MLNTFLVGNLAGQVRKHKHLVSIYKASLEIIKQEILNAETGLSFMNWLLIKY